MHPDDYISTKHKQPNLPAVSISVVCSYELELPHPSQFAYGAKRAFSLKERKEIDTNYQKYPSVVDERVVTLEELRFFRSQDYDGHPVWQVANAVHL